MEKWILFDFDGTLVDSAEAFLRAWNEVSTKYAFKPLRREDIPSLLKYTIKERAAMYNFPMLKLPIILPGIYKTYRQHIDLVTIKPYVREVIAKLRAEGYRLAVLSSNEKQNIESFLHAQKIEGFEEILTSSKLFGKDAVMKKFMKSKSAHILYVGDEIRDVAACQKVGMPIVAITWGYDARSLLEAANPTYIVNDFYELEQTIKDHFAAYSTI